MTSEIPWQQIHSLVNALATSFDDKWRERRRKIGTAFLTIFLMRIGFSRSQSGYQIVIDEIWDSMRKSGIELPQDKPFTASSVCEARKKLDPKIIHEMNREITDSFLSLNHDRFRWNGLRLFVVDGSTTHLPPELKQEGFGRMNPGMHYPQGKISVLMHAGSGIAADIILDHKGDERELAIKHLDALIAGEDVVIYDRGYFSYELVMAHMRKSIGAIFRMPLSGCLKQIQEFIDNPEKPIDEIVSVALSKDQKRHILRRHRNFEFATIRLRLVRYFIGEQEYVLATSILNTEIESQEFVEVYHERWGIEEHYKACKSLLSLEKFHSKSLQGVLQEVYTAELMLTLSRLVTLETQKLLAISQETPKKSYALMSQFVVQIFSMLKPKNTVIPKIRRSRKQKTSQGQ